jgi:hypothetical protein
MSSQCSSSGVIYSDFNYETLRSQNLQKVQDYYNNVLSKYTMQYNDYLTKSTSSNQADKDQANYMATEGELPKMNLHLIDVINEMNSKIEEDITNLKIQQEKVDKDTKIILANRQLIDDLNRALKMKMTDVNKNNSSYLENNDDNTTNSYCEIFFVIVNLLLLGGICWLFYSVLFGNKSSNKSTTSVNSNSKNI